MTTTIQKWGNSLAVRLPRELARRMQLGEGSPVAFSIEGDAIVLARPKKPRYTLDKLLKDFDKKAQHPLVDWGPDMGSEMLPPWRG